MTPRTPAELAALLKEAFTKVPMKSAKEEEKTVPESDYKALKRARNKDQVRNNRVMDALIFQMDSIQAVLTKAEAEIVTLKKEVAKLTPITIEEIKK